MRISVTRPAIGALALATVLLTAVTGCSSESDAGSGSSELLTGLGALAGDADAKQLTFLDAAAVRKLSKDDPERFAFVSRPSSPLLSSYGPGLLGKKFEETQIDTAVDTAEAGHWEGSFDTGAITASLKSSGYTKSDKDGQEVWSHPEGKGVTLKVSDDSLSYSSLDSDPMAVVSPEDGSALADDSDFRSAAECLGDVYRADFNRPDSSGPVRLASAGQQASSAAKNTEVLCFVVKDDAAAEKLRTDLEQTVKSDAPKFDGTKVSVRKGDRPVVRAVVPDTAEQRPGRLVVSDMALWMAAAG
ncbi:hypothetical protein AB0D35_19910 [Streptomyces sp. NPDC048301]|uniref:hypothetical protein n=1 Tax=unclassified Streptomyces TaxID=2593676 RepID=UPI003442B8A7